MKLIYLFGLGSLIGGITFAALVPPQPDPSPRAYPAPVVATVYPAPGYAPAPVLPTPGMRTPTSAPTFTPVATDPAPMCPPEVEGCVP